MTGLNKSKLPMTATERSPYRPARASKREFGLLDAGFISDTIGPGQRPDTSMSEIVARATSF